LVPINQFFDSYYLKKGSNLASLYPRSLHFNKNKLKEILAFTVTGSNLKHGSKFSWTFAFEPSGRSGFERCFCRNNI